MPPNDDDLIDWDSFVILNESGADPLTSLAGSLKDNEAPPSSNFWASVAALVVLLLVIFWLII
jgi:hypothetical protein